MCIHHFYLCSLTITDATAKHALSTGFAAIPLAGERTYIPLADKRHLLGA